MFNICYFCIHWNKSKGMAYGFCDFHHILTEYDENCSFEDNEDDGFETVITIDNAYELLGKIIKE